MANWLKFVVAFATAFVLMLAFRALAFSLYTVEGNALAPCFVSGDRLLVNRWSYGLRISGEGIMPYGRLMRSGVSRGDVVAFDMSADSIPGIFMARCKAIPGDTISTVDGPLLVPGRVTCAPQDYYWLESLAPGNPADSPHLGFVAERHIIGRVVGVLYSHDDSKSVIEGYRPERSLLW